MTVCTCYIWWKHQMIPIWNLNFNLPAGVQSFACIHFNLLNPEKNKILRVETWEWILRFERQILRSRKTISSKYISTAEMNPMVHYFGSREGHFSRETVWFGMLISIVQTEKLLLSNRKWIRILIFETKWPQWSKHLF